MNERHHLPRWLRQWIAQRLARPVIKPGVTGRSRQVALYKVDRLGDFVLATGALHTLVRHFGAEHCRLIVSDAAAPWAAAEFPTVERWVLPAQTSGVWRELRPLRARLAPLWAEEKFARIVCLRHARTLHCDVTLAWLHADEWRGLGDRPTASTLSLANCPELPDGYPTSARLPWCRELAAHRAVVAEILGAEPGWDDIRPRLRSVTAKGGGAVVVCPFGAEPIRDYPRAHWAAAWRETMPRGTSVRIIGSGSRRADLELFAGELRSAGAAAFVETDLAPQQFLQAVAGARLVLTVESAAAHVATALDRPAVVIMGGGHHGWFGPWGEGVRQRWISHRLDCFGCNWQCRRERVECLTELAPSALAIAIKEALAHE